MDRKWRGNFPIPGREKLRAASRRHWCSRWLSAGTRRRVRGTQFLEADQRVTQQQTADVIHRRRFSDSRYSWRPALPSRNQQGLRAQWPDHNSLVPSAYQDVSNSDTPLPNPLV